MSSYYDVIVVNHRSLYDVRVYQTRGSSVIVVVVDEDARHFGSLILSAGISVLATGGCCILDVFSLAGSEQCRLRPAVATVGGRVFCRKACIQSSCAARLSDSINYQLVSNSAVSFLTPVFLSFPVC